MTINQPPTRRPARVSRWVASGMTAAVAVGSVGAMSQAHEEESADDLGATFGAIARYRGEVSAAESVAAADPGDVSAAPLPPRLGGAGVS